MSTQERVRNNLHEITSNTICDVLERMYGIKPDHGAIDEQIRDAVDRMCGVAEICYGVPAGIVEVRAGVKKYAVDSDDEKAIRVELSMMNTQDNRLALAVIGDSTVKIRALQSDVEAKLRRDSRAQEKAAEHPGQLDLADVEPEPDGGEIETEPLSIPCHSCAGTGMVANVEDPQQGEPCEACGGTGSITEEPSANDEELAEAIIEQVPCVACDGTGISVIEGEEHCAACDGTGLVPAEDEAEPDTEPQETEEADEQTSEEPVVENDTVYEPVEEEVEAPANVTAIAGKQPKAKGGRRRELAAR